MELFEGYVLQSELADKANVTSQNFANIKNLKFKSMGGYICILKDSLPPKYQKNC